MSPPGIQIAFLQENDIGFCVGQEVENPRELQTSVNVPVQDPDGTGRAKHPAPGRKIACFDLLH
jgi:hypothetical protein